MRSDAPERKPRGRGHLPELTTVASRSAAIMDLSKDMYAASSRQSIDSVWNTVKAMVALWDLPVLPLTRESLVALGSTLKAGEYRTADKYLRLYRKKSEESGAIFTPDLERLLKDTIRSCQRGLGGPTKALALPLLRLGELPQDELPWVLGGPLHPRRAMIAGAWFLCREVELSTTRASLVEVSSTKGALSVSWTLPVSKSDSEALGVARSHGCGCSSSPSAGCPYHAIAAQLDFLRVKFPEQWSNGKPSRDLPLFPSAVGEVVSKDSMTATILEAARLLGCPLSSPGDSARVSGHSLRVTGAQGLSMAGVDTWAIQLLGRWGSSSVLGYIREAPLARSSSWAAWVTASPDLDQVLRAPQVRVRPSASAPPPISPPDVAQALAVELASADTDLRGQPIKYVLSAKKFYHRLPPHGDFGPVGSWATACGWKFAGSNAQLIDVIPAATLHLRICAKCLPQLWEAAKQRFVSGGSS